MKTTIYKLLGMIKDGKAPKRVKITGTIYEYDEESTFYFAHFKDYSVALGGKEDEINLLYNAFNENVEILDEPKEDKIGKLEFEFEVIDETDFVNKYPRISYMIATQQNKINELIDEVNKLKVNNEPK